MNREFNKIPLNISSQIITIGPDYHNHRGGIGAVLEIYNNYFEKFKFMPTYQGSSKTYDTIFFIANFFKLLGKLTFDRKIKIVHIHGASYGSFFRKFICFIIAKYVFDKKVIYHIHGGGYQIFYSKSNFIIRLLIKVFLENVSCVICLSESWKLYFKSNFKPKNIEIVPNIIDYPKAVMIKKESKIVNFLFLGLLCNNKGIFDLLDVIAHNKIEFAAKIKLIIGGNGEVERLLKFILDENLEDIVEYKGWLDKEEKLYWLNNADVYILPSYIEGVPISILEAMSYGKPIISSNVGGIPEIVENNVNGLLIEPGNKISLYNAINFYLTNNEKIQTYGFNSLTKVKNYLPSSVINKLSSIYFDIL